MNDTTPNVGLLTSSDIYRMNSTAAKISEAFEASRAEARDEALWLSAIARQLLRDNDRLRVENEGLRERIDRLAKAKETTNVNDTN